MNGLKLDFTIDKLGKPSIQSPISLSKEKGDFLADYVDDDQYILYNIMTRLNAKPRAVPNREVIEPAGPREKIYFDPSKARAGIVTCGGLCPGLNGVIRSIVMTLFFRYGAKRVCGFRFGYRGLLPEFKIPVMDLSPEIVTGIHRQGGTILGSSRGHGDKTEEIVDTLERLNIQMLFAIGGDGTQRGALDISREVKKRGLKIAIVGIPKTIDNDLSFVQKSFGFETAVSRALDAVSGAHVEAHDAVNGIGLVKVMGRESGYIAAHTALAINDANYVLIPEVPFDLEGENGLLAHLERRLQERNHAVILTAEGAGQDLMKHSSECDPSGNQRLTDIGLFLKEKIKAHFKKKNTEINLKYIDPSYIIRSAPANPNDSIYCARLGADAVHAAMSGRTGLIISLLHDQLVHIPIAMTIAQRNCINPDSDLWRDVSAATGQTFMKERRTKKREKTTALPKGNRK